MSIAVTNETSEAIPPPARPTDGPPAGAGTGRTPLWRLVLRRPLAAVCLGYLVLLVVVSIAAPVVASHPPSAVDLDSVMSNPTAEHLLGTDPLGRDVLSRLVFGGRISLINAAVATLVFVLVGTASGLVAGVIGGWVDRAFTWVVDLLIAVPALIVLLVIVSVFGSNMIVAMVAFGILASPGFARVVRGVALAVRQELSIVAAQVSGLGTGHIVGRHVLPRVSGTVLVHSSLFCGGALIIEAGLAYLGLGVQPPTPTWGGMIAEASTVIHQHRWLLVPPGVTVALAALAFALLGDAVRDATAERAGRTPVRASRRRVPGAGSPSPDTPAAPARAASLLSMRGVSITVRGVRGDLTVVRDLDLDIDLGETVGLVGESGCGKSITGRAILGLLPAGARVSSGSIRIGDTQLAGAGRKELRRLRGSRIGVISQEPLASLDPMFTVWQQVGELVRRHHRGSRTDTDARVRKLLTDVALPDPEAVARRYPHELSGGMAQRVAIALALAGEPELLIADEPTTALDVTVQAEILELLRQLQSTRDMAVLLISHDWGVIAQNCARSYVMYAGQIVEAAPTAQMLDRPSHPYTAGLLRSMPRRAEPGQPLAAIPGTVPSPGQWPPGCHFAPRCPVAIAECDRAPIPLLAAAADHHSRCIRVDVVRGGDHD